MKAVFPGVFAFALIVNVITTLRSSFRSIFVYKIPSHGKGDGVNVSMRLHDEERHRSAEITKRYLFVYLLAVFSDWVKGPYSYELYSSGDHYNFDSSEIHILCSVIPFVSSMVFGPLICGPIADNGFDLRSGGRKQLALMFAFVTIASNVTRHFRNFKALAIGSTLEGISTSLLFTVFDSWLVRAHRENTTNSSASSISLLFATTEYRNNIVAIGANLISTMVAGITEFQPVGAIEEPENYDGAGSSIFYVGGVLNPFDLSSFALALCIVSIHIFWDEHYGGHAEEENEKRFSLPLEDTPSSWWRRYRSSLAGAFMTVINSKEILLTGLICSLFESSMFIFVFTWTNAILSRMEGEREIPFGLVFATFMFGCMTGTSVFTLLIENMKMKVESVRKGFFFVATCTFIGMAIAKSVVVTMLAFFLLETLVGIYFPMMGGEKSEIVPENYRTTIYNIYRIPFNAIMIIYLALSGDPSPELSFAICACMVGVAGFIQLILSNCQKGQKMHLL